MAKAESSKDAVAKDKITPRLVLVSPLKFELNPGRKQSEKVAYFESNKSCFSCEWLSLVASDTGSPGAWTGECDKDKHRRDLKTNSSDGIALTAK